MTWQYSHADDGNIVLTGTIDPNVCGGDFVRALGFGRTASEAGQQAYGSLLTGFDEVARQYVSGWQEYQARCHHRNPKPDGLDLYRVSTAVLRTHEGKRFRGGRIASLSLPWGQAATDTDLGGYHLVWPRDQVEAAGEHQPTEYLRETADNWNAQIEDWTYVRDTDLARRVGVDGYYVRLAPPEVLEHGSPR